MTRPLDDDSVARTVQLVATGLYQTQALYVATKLGVADLLADGPKTAEALALQLHVDADRLSRVLRYLCSLGIFEPVGDGTYANNAASDHLRATPRGSMGDLVLWFGEEFYSAWGNLLKAVRTGRDAFGITFGCGLFEYLSRQPARGRAFDRAMASGATFFGALGELYDFSPYRTVVDVGGGNGTALIELLRRYPELEAVLFEAPPVLETARANLEDAGVGHRCRLVGGDFFESVAGGGDIYVLARVLHDWTDDQCMRILRNCRQSIDPAGRLMVLERLIPGPLALGADLNMLAVTQGRERSREELSALLARSGFELEEVVPLPLEVMLSVARPVL